MRGKKMCVVWLTDLISWWVFDSEARMAKYWAAKEMAKGIMEGNDDTKYNYIDVIFSNTYRKNKKYLTQLFKKEWFR